MPSVQKLSSKRDEESGITCQTYLRVSCSMASTYGRAFLSSNMGNRSEPTIESISCWALVWHSGNKSMEYKKVNSVEDVYTKRLGCDRCSILFKSAYRVCARDVRSGTNTHNIFMRTSIIGAKALHLFQLGGNQ